jgi:hypothetical protein
VIATQNNRVAVKVLNVEGMGGTRRAALRQEALMMCQLFHPAIARAYGESRWTRRAFFVLVTFKAAQGTAAGIIH